MDIARSIILASSPSQPDLIWIGLDTRHLLLGVGSTPGRWRSVEDKQDRGGPCGSDTPGYVTDRLDYFMALRVSVTRVGCLTRTSPLLPIKQQFLLLKYPSINILT